MITIKNLIKTYGQKRALHSINIQFQKGKVYGVVGENGAGKTTLFNCIAGLETCSGQITSSYKSLKNTLGFLPTEFYFLPKLTGAEYIELLAFARQIQLQNIEEKNIFNLPLKDYISTYSTGMKKKPALTAILLQNNDLFILDEPFNGVDIQSNLIITEIINKLKQLNKTVIMSSHIFSTLTKVCDEIFVLKQGQLIKQVDKNDFPDLENEMKTLTITNQIDTLNLK